MAHHNSPNTNECYWNQAHPHNTQCGHRVDGAMWYSACADDGWLYCPYCGKKIVTKEGWK